MIIKRMHLAFIKTGSYAFTKKEKKQ